MGDITQMLPLLLLFVVMYFFLIRPGLQKQKKEKKYLEALKAGDKVVSAAVGQMREGLLVREYKATY